MLKSNRHKLIVDIVNKNGSIKVKDIVDRLEISDMTVRRDLTELEEKGLLRRVHGGAVSINNKLQTELSHEDKRIINVKEKEIVAEVAVNLIDPEDIVFIGPGTTMEIFSRKIIDQNNLFVTNSLPVFQTLIEKGIEVYLLGGKFRKKTESFNGMLTIEMVSDLKFHKAFFSCNGVHQDEVMTATLDEGATQEIALNNSSENYLVIDSSKIGKEDFYTYYKLSDITAVIVDKDQDEKYLELETYTNLILAEEK